MNWSWVCTFSVPGCVPQSTSDCVPTVATAATATVPRLPTAAITNRYVSLAFGFLQTFPRAQDDNLSLSRLSLSMRPISERRHHRSYLFRIAVIFRKWNVLCVCFERERSWKGFLPHPVPFSAQLVWWEVRQAGERRLRFPSRVCIHAWLACNLTFCKQIIRITL